MMDHYLPMFAPWAVAHAEGIALRVQPNAQPETVLVPDRPWEGGFLTLYVSMIHDQGLYRLWYTCRDKALRRNIAYAQSVDGLHWEKPSLGICRYEGSMANNLVGLTDVDGSIYLDEQAPAHERYKYVSSRRRDGLVVRSSPDGLHWQDAEAILPFSFDTQNVMLRDPETGRYIFYLRGWEIPDNRVYHNRRRFVVRYETDDPNRSAGIAPMTTHPEGKLVHVTGEMPEIFGTDQEDPTGGDVYTMCAQPYCPRCLIAFPTMLRRVEMGDPDIIYPGRTEVQFIASSDGHAWQRFDRRPLLTPSLDTGIASSMVYAGQGLAYVGDEIWQYGTGYRAFHGDIKALASGHDGVILRWRHRRDGFVAAEAGYHGGTLITTHFVIDEALYLNVDTGAFGDVCVELMDEQGTVIPGYEAVACKPIQTNSVQHEVVWNGADISTLYGRTVQARVSGHSFRLFGIGMPEKPPRS